MQHSHATGALLAAAAALLAVSSATAQVSYVENFDTSAAGWTQAGTATFEPFQWFSDTTACTTGAMRTNLYTAGANSNDILVSPLLGTSTGTPTTISYSYKLHLWQANTVPTGTPWGTIDVEYADNAAGPWTNIATIMDEVQTTGCIAKTHTFSPPAGPLFVRFNCNWTGFDSYWNIDDVSVIELGAGTLATNTSYGVACGGNVLGDATFYEVFDGVNLVDLANTSYKMTWTGDGYVALPLPVAIVPPTGAPLAINDDQVVPITLPAPFICTQGLINDVYLSSNGFLSFEPTTDSDLSETVAEMLADPTALRFLWDDLNPADPSSGPVNAEVDANGIFHITFTDVPEFGTTTANTVQVSLHPNGDIDIKYGALSLADCIVGFSTGNGSSDPGGIDISASPVIVLTTGVGPFYPDLELVGSTRPIIGTSWDLTTNNIEAVSPVGITFFGTRAPVSLPLTAIGLPAPGCEIHLNSTIGAITGNNVGGSTTVSLPLPNNPALVGQMFAVNSIALSLSNAANLTSSNGVEGVFGDI